MQPGKSRRNRGKKRRARSCGGKVPYSQADATNAAFLMSRRSGVKYNPYKCDFCYLPSGACAWHVGHATSLKRRLK